MRIRREHVTPGVTLTRTVIDPRNPEHRAILGDAVCDTMIAKEGTHREGTVTVTGIDRTAGTITVGDGGRRF